MVSASWHINRRTFSARRQFVGAINQSHVLAPSKEHQSLHSHWLVPKVQMVPRNDNWYQLLNHVLMESTINSAHPSERPDCKSASRQELIFLLPSVRVSNLSLVMLFTVGKSSIICVDRLGFLSGWQRCLHNWNQSLWVPQGVISEWSNKKITQLCAAHTW